MLGGALIVATLLSACTGAQGDAVRSTQASSSGPQSFSSVTDLRDAAEAAGYVCKNWHQDNKVTLAAESATCSSESVLSTYASEGDLQRQLDNEKKMGRMLASMDIEQTDMLVGTNWILKDPDAAELRDLLGGVVVSPKS